MPSTAYKSKIIKLKLDKDPLHCLIYFLSFIESLEMIFSKYRETFEVILYYPAIGGEDIKYYVNKATRNNLHANIYVHSIILVSEFP